MGCCVDFKCDFCKYEETHVGVARGASEFPFLARFRCDHCQSIGGTWIHARRLPHRSLCYHDHVTILPDDTRRVNCPKCGSRRASAFGKGAGNSPAAPARQAMLHADRRSA